MFKKLIFLIGCVFIANSCAFNSLYYVPDKNAVVASANAEEIYINYEGEKSIHALYFKKEKPIASIFILHGNAGNLTGWQSIAEMLWEENYQTFIFDYPGFGNSDGKPKHNDVILSAQKAFDYFNAIPEVAATKKIMMGFSLGGNLALKIATDNQTNIDALVIEGAFTSYRAIGIHRTPKIFRFAPFLLLGTKFKGEELAKNWTKPLLVVHSTDDNVCPYNMGKEIYSNAGSVRKEMWTIKGPHIAGFANYGSEYLYKLKNLVVE